MTTRFFHRLGTLCVVYPWYVMVGCTVLILGMLPLVIHLPFEADLHETLPRHIVTTMERHDRVFGTSELAFLLLQAPRPARSTLLALGEAFQQTLTPSPLIRQVEFGPAEEVLQLFGTLTLDYAPLFVSPEQVESFEALFTPDGIRTQLHKTLLALNTVGGNAALDSALQSDPLQLRRFTLARLAALRGAFWMDASSPYFLSPDGTALLLKITGQVAANDMARVKAILQLLHRSTRELLALPEFQEITVRGTGAYFFAAESEQTIRRDLTRSVGLAVAGICLLVAWSFRRWGVLVYGQIPTLAGLLIALGLFALIRPKLNALTLGCSAALIGLGIDFTIHMLTQCFTELGGKPTKHEAIRTALRETGSSLFLAAMTTIAAFAAFLFSEQRFLQDMGLLAMLGIFSCLCLCVLLLPSLVATLPIGAQNRPPRTLGVPMVVAGVLKAPRLTLACSLVLSCGAAVTLIRHPPRFETDLRNLAVAESPALNTQTAITTIFGGSQSPITLLLTGTTEEEVLQAMQRLEAPLQQLVADGALAAVTSLGSLIPAHTTQEKMLHTLRQLDPEALVQELATRLDEAGFDVQAFESYVDSVRRALSRRAPLDLATLRTLGFTSFLRTFIGQDVHSITGRMVLFPATALWTHEANQRLSERVTTLLAQHNVHGSLLSPTLLSTTSTAHIGRDFSTITFLAVSFIIPLLCIQFRRPRAIGLVVLPVACGALWTAGVLVLWGWKLNFMNIAILPMLLGIGIDDGIHIVHRFSLPTVRDTRQALRMTGSAVLLTSLTTILAFGTLAFSENQGIASVGLLALTGVTACLLASLTTLPAALQLWGASRQPQR
jgi:predicted RND superfamily exporter protein